MPGRTRKKQTNSPFLSRLFNSFPVHFIQKVNSFLPKKLLLNNPTCHTSTFPMDRLFPKAYYFPFYIFPGYICPERIPEELINKLLPNNNAVLSFIVEKRLKTAKPFAQVKNTGFPCSDFPFATRSSQRKFMQVIILMHNCAVEKNT